MEITSDTLKRSYSRLTDYELVKLLGDKGLKEEALLLLRKELDRRRIGEKKIKKIQLSMKEGEHKRELDRKKKGEEKGKYLEGCLLTISIFLLIGIVLILIGVIPEGLSKVQRDVIRVILIIISSGLAWFILGKLKRKP